MNADKPRRGPRPNPRNNPRSGPNRGRQRGGGRRDERYWLFGRHAVAAACANPQRQIHRLLAIEPRSWQSLGRPVEEAARDDIAQLLPPGAVHQGIAALVDPLPPLDLDEACAPQIAPIAGSMAHALSGGAVAPRNLVIALDQVEDSQNVGTILRSAAAFGVRAVLLPDRHAAPESGLMARAAVGMLERVPLVRVVNLSRALERLAALGYWRYGLAADAPQPVHRATWADNVALVVGAEGRGLRRLTAESCDGLLSIAMAPGVESLNVSAATAIALHEVYRLNC